jgi:membrane protein
MSRHGADGLAAGIAFGSLLSAAPLLLVVLAVAGVVLGDGTAKEGVLDLVREALGSRPTRLVSGWIDEVRAWSATATVVGLGFFIFGSGRLALLVDAALEVIFEVPPAPAKSFFAAVREYFHLHLTSLAVTSAASVLLVVALLIRASAPWVLGELADTPIGWTVQAALSFGLVFGSVALAYRYLPPLRLTYPEIFEGALVTTIPLALGFMGLRALTRWIDLGAAYGAAGAVIGTLIALYFAAQIFLFGAELTAELSYRRRRGKPSPAGRPLEDAPVPEALPSVMSLEQLPTTKIDPKEAEPPAPPPH